MNSRAHDRVLRQRLATQRLTSTPVRQAAESVRLLTCAQSQERDHAYYSLGMRTADATYTSVAAEADAGAFLRTHILRPTWHFVAPEDLRWIQALTGPRVTSSMGARHTQLGLGDVGIVDEPLEVLADLLRGPNPLTRKEIGDAFAAMGGALPQAGEPLGHLLMLGELRALICSGPAKGVHHTYVLVDEVVPPSPQFSREESVARLVHRFFAGHGPATIKDFTRWSSLTIAGALAGLAELGDALEQVEIDGIPLWFDPSVPRRTTRDVRAFLFPVYDEAILTYPSVNFPTLDGHPHALSDDPFWARVVVDRVNVGLWKRTIKSRAVTVETRLAPDVTADQRAEVAAAAQLMATFLERDLAYVENEGTPHLWGGELGHPTRRARRADR